MRSILEKAFVALLNEEHDKAEELFHKFIVERARQIHESNRAGDDFVLDENWNDEITAESYFTEDDLSDLTDEDNGEGEEDFGAEDGAEGEGQDDDFGGIQGSDEEGDMDADMDGDMEMDADQDIEGDLDSTDEKIDHLTDQIDKLTAEFAAMMDAIGDEGEGMDDAEGDADGEDFGAGDDFDGMDGEEEGEADGVADDMDGAEEEPAMEDEEYDDITESIIDELEKVSVSLEDGHEIGTGKSFTQNRGAALQQKGKDARQGGAPIKMKQDAHKGFERETAPAVDTLKPRRNNVKSDKTVLAQKVSKEGDKSAELNKLSSENGNTKSPLEGK